MWRRVIALTIKEFLTLLKDKRSRMVIIVPPLVQLFVFGYAATFDLNHVPYAVYNEDNGYVSREFLSRIEGSGVFSLIETLRDEERIPDMIDNEKALVVVRIGPNFSRDVLLGRTGKVQVIMDGRNSNTALTASGYIRDIATDFNAYWDGRTGKPPPPAELAVRAWFNPAFESRWFIVPGIVALLTMVVTMTVTALSVAREREAGTFDQLLVTPLRPVDILLGKTLPGFIIGFVEVTFIILAAVYWFEVPLRGSVFALYAGLFLFLLSTIGAGLMVSSIAVTQQQGLLGAFMVLVPAIILSGFATPIANMPPLMQYLTYINPMRYFLIIIRGVFLQGADISVLWPQYWPMAAIGTFCLVLAGSLFRHRLY